MQLRPELGALARRQLSARHFKDDGSGRSVFEFAFFFLVPSFWHAPGA